MKVKAVLLVRDQVVGEVTLSADRSAAEGAREAYRTIRRAYPKLPLLDKEVRVHFEKLDESAVQLRTA